MGSLLGHWRVLAAAVVALLVGAGVGLSLGSSGATSKTKTVTLAKADTTSSVSTVYKTRTRTVRIRTPQAAGVLGSVTPGSGTPSVGAPANSSPVVPTGPPGPAQHFAGTGSKTLGTVTIKGTATLRWTNTAGRIELLFDGGSIGLDSTAHAGTMTAPAGVYQEVRVQSAGNWTISIS